MLRIFRPPFRPLLRPLLALACALSAGSAHAAYPDQPIKIIVPFAAGGLADITVRLVGEKLTAALGQPVLIDNRPGAGGVPAAQAAMGGKPDGYTLLVYTNGTAISKSLYKKLPFDPQKDFVPVSLLAYFDLVVLVKKDSPYKTLGELLAETRAKPGKINIGTINPGSTQNLSAELFRTTANIDAAIVPFRTTPDVTRAVLAGDVDAIFESYAATKAQVDAGNLRPLANSAAKRAEYLPQVPTAAEAGVKGYEVTGWNALVAPAGTPPAVVATLNREINKIIAAPEVKKRLLDLGTTAYAGTPDELKRQLAKDIPKWAAVIKKAGIPQE
jgi:tripartite-type tricarboxylate transporter receptor subunit TctC